MVDDLTLGGFTFRPDDWADLDEGSRFAILSALTRSAEMEDWYAAYELVIE